MLGISIFVDDVIFFYNRLYGSLPLPQQARCSVMHGLIPLLHGIGLRPVLRVCVYVCVC